MLKIAITGPESTGKSALSEALAQHYNTLWVPEFARTYLADTLPPYTPEMLDEIAQGQVASQIAHERKNPPLLFCDTEMTVMKIWSEHAFGFCSDTIEKLYINQHYDLYLLTDIDLPWQPDPLREHPDLRSYFFDLYKDELIRQKRNYAIISGIGLARIKNAISVVDKMVNAHK